jgi:hypothetical protein
LNAELVLAKDLALAAGAEANGRIVWAAGLRQVLLWGRYLFFVLHANAV